MGFKDRKSRQGIGIDKNNPCKKRNEHVSGVVFLIPETAPQTCDQVHCRAPVPDPESCQVIIAFGLLAYTMSIRFSWHIRFPRKTNQFVPLTRIRNQLSSAWCAMYPYSDLTTRRVRTTVEKKRCHARVPDWRKFRDNVKRMRFRQYTPTTSSLIPYALAVSIKLIFSLAAILRISALLSGSSSECVTDAMLWDRTERFQDQVWKQDR